MGGFRMTFQTRLCMASGRCGRASLFPGGVHHRSARTSRSSPCPVGCAAGPSPSWQGIQFLPVLLFQAAGILGLLRFGLGRMPAAAAEGSNLGVDQQQKGGGQGEEGKDADAEPDRA